MTALRRREPSLLTRSGPTIFPKAVLPGRDTCLHFVLQLTSFKPHFQWEFSLAAHTGSLHWPSLPRDELTNLCRPGAEENIRWKNRPYMLH
jgi:hypothetical protein